MNQRVLLVVAIVAACAGAILVVAHKRGGDGGPGDAAAVPSPPADAAVAEAPPPSPREADEQCADCHPEEAEGFARTGMGRSLYRPQSVPPIEDFTPEKATVVHAGTGLTYRAYVDEEGRWWQSETLPGTDYERRVEAKWVIGSGNHTRSYIGEVEGELVELPMTWYSRRGIWDMSPGYEPAGNNYRFDRPIVPQCLFCHNDLTPVRPGTMAGYEGELALGIGCNRCHGNGAAHVKLRLEGDGPPAGQPDETILNPKRLPMQRQHRVCEQCHLQGSSRVLLDGQRWDAYDVREPLENYLSIWVPKSAGGPEFGIASHGHRLLLSACAQKSDGQLGCTTCHDPHRPGDAKANRAACLSCHQPQDCGEKHGLAADADCASCHMRRGDTSDIPHVTFTDHFIRKRPEADEPRPELSLELVDALAATRAGPDPEAPLREAFAHFEVFRFGKAANRRAHLPVAHRLLKGLAGQFPEDPRVWRHLGDIAGAMRDANAAVDAYARAAKLAPDEPLILPDYAEALEGLDRLSEAETVLRRAIELRPDFRAAWGNLANNLQRQGRHDEAEAAYAQADRLAPHLAITANNRGHNFLNQGRFEEARRWFEEALRRDPTDPLSAFNLALSWVQAEQPAQALPTLDRALARDPDFPLGRWLRGRARLAAGDPKGARDDFEHLISLDPKNAAGYLELARTWSAHGDRQTAKAVLMRGVMLVGPSPELGRALQQLEAEGTAGAAPGP